MKKVIAIIGMGWGTIFSLFAESPSDLKITEKPPQSQEEVVSYILSRDTSLLLAKNKLTKAYTTYIQSAPWWSSSLSSSFKHMNQQNSWQAILQVPLASWLSVQTTAQGNLEGISATSLSMNFNPLSKENQSAYFSYQNTLISYQSTVRNTVLSIRSALRSLGLAQKNSYIAEKTLQLAQKGYEKVLLLSQQGAATQQELLTAFVSLNKAQNDMVMAQAELANQYTSLALRAGCMPDDFIPLETLIAMDTEEVSEDLLNHIMTQAEWIAHSVNLQQARLSAEQAAIEAQSAVVLPDLSISGDISVNFGKIETKTNWSLGMSVKIPLDIVYQEKSKNAQEQVHLLSQQYHLTYLNTEQEYKQKIHQLQQALQVWHQSKLSLQAVELLWEQIKYLKESGQKSLYEQESTEIELLKAQYQLGVSRKNVLDLYDTLRLF